MNEKEKMLNGELYDAEDEELTALRIKAQELCIRYNSLLESQREEKEAILKELLPTSKNFFLRGPIYFDYGFNTEIGEQSYANFNFCVLDCAKVKIGNHVYFGPNVCISTAGHPILPEERNPYFSEEKGRISDREFAKPITIEDNCWIGANVTILPGVLIGEGTVIGAGSVVTKSIPSGVIAFGNPCKIHRKIDKNDSFLKN